MRKILGLLGLISLAACHPSVFFRAPKINNKAISVNSNSLEKKQIDIAFDEHGIPSIKSNNLDDAMFALGFLHARDRLFQLDLIRHAALGKLSELFGKKMLNYDRKLRVLSFRLEEQEKNLSKFEREKILSYVNGVNLGAKHRGRSLEHFLLGTEFEDLEPTHVIAIARLQSWQLAFDLLPELTRLKIARSDLTPEAKMELLATIDDRSAAVLHDDTKKLSPEKFIWPEYLQKTLGLAQKQNENVPKDSAENFVQMTGGASNAWAVNGKFMKDGNAVLMNDPHLRHQWPSTFYLASIFTKEISLRGATFVGVPAIVIGASDKLAWGVTASYINTQDTALLKIDETDTKYFLVDGKREEFLPWPQKFCSNKFGDCEEVLMQTTKYGPVLDNSFDEMIDAQEKFVLMWTGFLTNIHKDLGGSFFKLSQSQNIEEAMSAVNATTFPGVNIIMADTLGNIGYSFAGIVPKRDYSQNPYLPLDGSKSQSFWSCVLKKEVEPHVINPRSGFLVTANQNIFSKGEAKELSYGKQGAAPYRAQRIKERILNLKDKGPIKIEDLVAIQYDANSIEAKDLAKHLGRACMIHFADQCESKKQFAKEIFEFDGNYHVNSYGALPFDLMIKSIVKDRIDNLLGENFKVRSPYIRQLSYQSKNSLLKKFRGQKSALFDLDQERFKNVLSNGCDRAYAKLVKKASAKRFKWRYGRHHYLQRQSPLAQAPVIGRLFKDIRREVAGTSSSPLAETGTPVFYGANMRLVADMKSTPQIKMIIDSGNSGNIESKNAFDQARMWHEEKSILFKNNWEDSFKNAESRFVLYR